MDPVRIFFEYGALALLYFIVGFVWYIIYKLSKRIEEVEKKNIEADGKFDVIENQLKNIGDNVQKILDHFMEKGMK
jgi:hypothetical protein